MNTFDSVKAWLESHQSKTELTSIEGQELKSLLGHPGLGHLLSLLLASRHAQYVALTHTPLGTAEASARASVIQGTIKGIDIIRETLLEQFVPAQADEGAMS